jgi:oligopeptidase A
MLANVNVVLSHPTIHEMEVDLAAMRVRLNEILATRPFEDHHFVEIAAIFNNVSYMFLYLESNSIHIDFDALLPWKDRFFNDERLDDQLLAALSGLCCAEGDLERSREAYVDVLRAKRHAEPDPSTEAIANGLLRAKEIVGGIAADVATFLKSLNVSYVGSRPDAAFYALASRTSNWATRRRLHSAWRRVRDRRLDDLAAVIDDVVRARWKQARRQRYPTVVRRTFEKCGVSVEQAETFLNEYTVRAIDSHAQLCRIIGDGTPAANATSMDEFGFHLVQRYGGDTMPMLALNGCLRFAFDVSHRVLGLDFERIDDVGDWLIQVDVLKDGRAAGRIHFDLWAEHNQPKDANFTRGLRNRTAWKTVEQIPVAHVSCRFRREDDSREFLNFQNVHSLFHEFGHALNHLFIKQRMPNQSGLEYLPLERLEILSMWFEKWIFHREFASYVTSSDVELNRLATAQEIKMLEYRRTHLDRAVTSLIDLIIHEQPDLGVKEAFRGLDERFGIKEACDFGAILQGFTWPMMQSNPGAYFAYLWAAGKSAEMFAPFLTSLLSDAPEARVTWERLAECFEFDHPSAAPTVESVFAFYGG